jgi:pyruvate dehydrogenase E2 component (dihydrolipoamide acetyltransferase)
VDAFTPILDPPQAAILGVGRVREVPGFEGDRVVRRRVTTLSLTFDHRVADGAPAARFLGRVSELVGSPAALR